MHDLIKQRFNDESDSPKSKGFVELKESSLAF